MSRRVSNDGGGMQMHFFGFFVHSKDVDFFCICLHFFPSILPSVFLFCGKPWTDVYDVVLPYDPCMS